MCATTSPQRPSAVKWCNEGRSTAAGLIERYKLLDLVRPKANETGVCEWACSVHRVISTNDVDDNGVNRAS